MTSLLNFMDFCFNRFVLMLERKYVVRVTSTLLRSTRHAIKGAVSYCPAGMHTMLGLGVYRLTKCGVHFGFNRGIVHVVGTCDDLREALANTKAIAVARSLGASTLIIGSIVLDLHYSHGWFSTDRDCVATLGCFRTAMLR